MAHCKRKDCKQIEAARRDAESESELRNEKRTAQFELDLSAYHPQTDVGLADFIREPRTYTRKGPELNLCLIK